MWVIFAQYSNLFDVLKHLSVTHMTQENKLKSGQIFFHNIGVKCYVYILQFHNTFFFNK